MKTVHPIPELTTADKLLFLQHVSKEPTETGCLLWKGNRSAEGYGNYRIGPKTWGAHRVAYWVKHGPPPVGLLIRHTCDNPQCCNPDHLIPGTHAQNMNDRVERKRPMLRRMRNVEGKSYISTTEAARELGIGPCRVAQLCKAGIIAGRQIHEGSWWQIEYPIKKLEEKP